MEPGEFDPSNFKFSKSSVKSLLECPKRFKLEYIERKKSKPSPSAIKGTRIHNLLEKVNKKEICMTEVPASYVPHIQNYIKFLREHKLQLPQYSEYKDIAVDIQGIHFKGILDALFIQDGKGVLIDYKTGHIKDTMNSVRFELQLYSALAEHSIPNLEVVRYGVLYTADGTFYSEVNDHKYEEIRMTINKVKQILEKKKMDAVTGEQCFRCFLRGFCDNYKEQTSLKNEPNKI